VFEDGAFYFEGAVFVNRAFCSVLRNDAQRHVDSFSTRGVRRCVRAFKTSSPCYVVDVLGMGLESCFALQKVEYVLAFREAKTRIWIASKQEKAALVLKIYTNMLVRHSQPC
jgi:hypothetical protein